MICPNCSTQYQIAYSAIPADGREVECGSCQTTWFQAPAHPSMIPVENLVEQLSGKSAPRKNSEVSDSSSQEEVVSEKIVQENFNQKTRQASKVVLVKSAPIVLISISVLDQIDQFRERVRGDNFLDPEFKDEAYKFLDQLEQKISNLLGKLPKDGSDLSVEESEIAENWLSEFKDGLTECSQNLICPKNVAGLAVPTGIVLGCTSIGALLGQPIAGALVGGLITSHLSPDKAIKQAIEDL